MTQQTKPDSKHSFRHAAAHACKRVWGVTCAVGTHPMFLFSVGNNALAWGEATHAGLAISLLGTAAVAGAIIREELAAVKTDLKKSMPYRTLAAVNFVTAATIMVERHLHNGPWLGALTSAACLSIWGVGHVFRGKLFPKGLQPRHVGENPLLYTSIADITASIKSGFLHAGFFAATPISVLGAFMVLRPEAPPVEVQTKKDFFRKHITRSRVLSAAYLAQTVLLATMHGPHYFMGATAAWTAGFIPFDSTKFGRAENKDFVPDFRKTFLRPALQSPGVA